MVRALAVVSVVLLSSCHNLELPLPPAPLGAGVVTGRVVWQRPGRFTAEPASGASVFLMNTNLGVSTSADGRFVLEGITSAEGSLWVRFDADADGTADHQRVLSLKELGAAPGRTVSTGDLSLGQPGSVSGKVQLSGRSDASGTPVFVPGLPLVALTSANGEFVLEGVMEGPLQVAAARDGFTPWLSSALTLRGGELLQLASVTLGVAALGAGADGTILSGKVLAPDGTAVSGAQVQLSQFAATTDANGAFRLTGVPAGRYDLRLSATGRAPVVLFNLLLDGESDLALPDLVMAPGSGTSGPSLLDQLQNEGYDGGFPPAGPFTVAITPDGVALKRNMKALFDFTTTPMVTPTAVRWTSTRGGLSITDDTASTVEVMASTIGSFDLCVTVAASVGTAPKACISGTVIDDTTVPSNPVRDAGATPVGLFVWANDGLESFDGSVTYDGFAVVPGHFVVDRLRSQAVYLFHEGVDAGQQLQLEGEATWADGGKSSFSRLTVLSRDWRFSPPQVLLSDAGALAPDVGLTWMPGGTWLAVARSGSSMSVLRPGSAPSSTSLVADGGASAGRRLVRQNKVDSVLWLDQGFTGAFDGTNWRVGAPTPGGAFFFGGGPSTLAIGPGDGGVLSAWSWNESGANWLEGSQISNLIYRGGDGATYDSAQGVGRLVVGVTTDLEAQLHLQQPGMGFTLLGGLITSVFDARVAATSSGGVVWLSTMAGHQLVFVNFQGAAPTAQAPIPVSNLLVDDVAAVGQFAVLFGVDPLGNQPKLQLYSLKTHTLVRELVLPASFPPVGVALATSDFGELSIALSEAMGATGNSQVEWMELQ